MTLDEFKYSERKRIGKRIAELRKKRGLTTAQLAELSGMVQQSVSRAEQGNRATTIDVLAKIAAALNVRLDFVENE